MPTVALVYFILGASDAAGQAFASSLPERLQLIQPGCDWAVDASDALFTRRFLRYRNSSVSTTPRHGLEITFGDTQWQPVLALRKRPFILCYSRGSTSLASWVAPGGHLEDATAFYQTELAALPVTTTAVEFGGLIQFIGGQDALVEAEALAFEANDTSLIATMRSTFGPMPAVLVRPSIDLEFAGVPPPFLAEMRAGLAATAANVADAQMLSTDAYALQADGTHLTSEGQQLLGIACAGALPP